MHKAYYTTGEAAAILRLNIKTIERNCRNGSIRARRIGGLWKIPATSLGLPMPEPVRLPGYINEHEGQLILDLPASMLTPIKVWRNSGNPIVRDWGTEYGRKKPATKQEPVKESPAVFTRRTVCELCGGTEDADNHQEGHDYYHAYKELKRHG